MGIFTTIFATPPRLSGFARGNGIKVSKKLVESGQVEVAAVLEKMNTTSSGLTSEEAEVRLEQYGPNEIAKEKHQTLLMRLWDNIKNPLVILLTVLGIVTYITGDVPGTIVIFMMVLLGIVLRYFQESRVDSAAEKLKAMVSTTATVMRDGKRQEIELKNLVPGDIVLLSAGDMSPADVRLLSARDFFLIRPRSQASQCRLKRFRQLSR